MFFDANLLLQIRKSARFVERYNFKHFMQIKLFLF